jgi:mutator family transposase
VRQYAFSSRSTRYSGDGDFLRSVAEAVLQILMEADVEGLIGAGRHERSAERLTYRNGYRDRSLDTRLGSLQLRIPKLRQGSYFPPFLEPRKTAEKALVMVIQEAWIGGVSTRVSTKLEQAMGLSGISKSQVSKLCKDIDERVNAFLERPIEGEWPYLWLDATYLKVRDGGRIVSVAAIIAMAVTTEGRREIIGLGIRPFGGRAVLVGLLEEPGQARPQGRQAGDLGRSRRPAPRHHPRARCHGDAGGGSRARLDLASLVPVETFIHVDPTWWKVEPACRVKPFPPLSISI